MIEKVLGGEPIIIILSKEDGNLEREFYTPKIVPSLLRGIIGGGSMIKGAPKQRVSTFYREKSIVVIYQHYFIHTTLNSYWPIKKGITQLVLWISNVSLVFQPFVEESRHD